MPRKISNTRQEWRHLVTDKNFESLQPTHSLWIKEILKKVLQQNEKKKKKTQGAEKENDLGYIFKYDPEEGKKA